MRSFVLTQVLIQASCSLILCGAVTAKPRCLVEDLRDVNVESDVYVDVTFRELRDRYYEISTVNRTVIDSDAKIIEYRRRVQTLLPDDRCGQSVSLRRTRDSVEGRSWVLRSGVRSRTYLCIKMDGFSCDWSGCRSREWVIREEDAGFRKTLELESAFVPRVVTTQDMTGDTNSDIVVDVESEIEDLERWEKDLLNMLKGIADVLKIHTFGMIDLRKHLDFTIPPTPGFELLRERFPSIPNFRPRVTNASFENTKRGLALAVAARDERKCAVAEEIYQYFKSAEQLLAQQEDREEHYEVRAGDSLWSLAEDKLGDGRFFLGIAQYNDVNADRAIQPGQDLRIPTIRRLQRTSSHMVGRGQNVWLIEGDSQEDFVAQVKRLKSSGRDPSLVYPGEVFP